MLTVGTAFLIEELGVITPRQCPRPCRTMASSATYTGHLHGAGHSQLLPGQDHCKCQLRAHWGGD